MMRSHAHKIFSSCFFKKLHEFFGIPTFCLPQRDDVLITKLRGMSIMSEMVFVIRIVFYIHFSGIPIALAGHSLRSPVCPVSEFGIAEPLGILILFERRIMWLKRSLAHWKIFPLLRSCLYQQKKTDQTCKQKSFHFSGF